MSSLCSTTVNAYTRERNTADDSLERKEPAAVFISFEPLLGDVEAVDLTGNQWAIVGGESGPGARPLHEDWVLSLKELCAAQGVLLAVGRPNKKRTGRLLLGSSWDDMPVVGGL